MVLSGYQQVGEFHEVFGHPHNTEKQYDIFNNNIKLVKFRVSLIEEEINELFEACDKKDLIEAIDAIADTMYVVYGAFHVIGLNYDKYSAKMAYTHFRHDVKHDDIFDNDYIAFELKTCLNDLKDSLSEINSKYIKESTNDCNGTYDSFVILLDEIIVYCYSIASLFRINIDECFNEVHRSNMTKVCIDEETAKQSVEWYKNNDSRYKDPSYRKSTNSKYWVVFDNGSSKILKSVKFELPKIASIIDIKQ